MFVNLKTNNPAWLIEHDGRVTYSLGDPEAGKPHHHAESYEFFAGHREATADELEAYYGKPKAPPAATRPARAATAAAHGRKGDKTSKPTRRGASAPSPTLKLRGRGGAGGHSGEPHGE